MTLDAPLPPESTGARRRRMWFWVGGGIVAVALIVAAIVVNVQLAERARVDRFIEIVKHDKTTSLDPEARRDVWEALYSVNCKKASDPEVTEDSVRTEASRIWDKLAHPDLTEQQVQDNYIALYRAAKATCG